MATAVVTEEKITLADGSEETIRPLVISKLRKFMDIWSSYQDEISKLIDPKVDENGEIAEEDAEKYTDKYLQNLSFEVQLRLVAICLDNLRKDNERDKAFQSRIEDLIDLPTLHRILKVCGGLSLGDEADPNLMVAPEGDGLT